MADWMIRFFCRCGDGVPHYCSFANPWFFDQKLCANCGARLKHSTVERTVRWRGPFWKQRLEVHPDSRPLPTPPRTEAEP
jgi:hypothetical protein